MPRHGLFSWCRRPSEARGATEVSVGTRHKSSLMTAWCGVVGCLGLAVSAGCSSTNAETNTVRLAIDVPGHFVIGEHDGPAIAEPIGSAECRNPMVDPRDGTRIVLVRSSGGEGDYEAPPGRYGVSKGEVLRLDCATGETIGIVRRE